MRDSDIRICDVQVTFIVEPFRVPLKLSTGPIADSTYAAVRITVENRLGGKACGIGGVFLSDLWSFPSPLLTHEEKADCMQETVRAISRMLQATRGYYDPLQISDLLEEQLGSELQRIGKERGYPIDIPHLLGIVSWSPFDAALHDAWGKAWGSDTYAMYHAEHLNEDLSASLGDAFKGQYPESYLLPPASSLMVQHVVGAADPLTAGDLISGGADLPQDGLPLTLSDWITRDGVHRLKLKLKGMDIEGNIQFIRDVFRIGNETLQARRSPHPAKLALDPNEAFSSPEPLEELLDRLREADLAAFEAVQYIEQPTPRDLSTYNFTLHGIAKQKPVIIDESLDSLDSLQQLNRLGWSGVALKTCKGQSHAIRAYCWAKHHGLYVTIQDLTNPGYAFVQSANLCSRLTLSADHIEFNSRQYVPESLPEERVDYPKLFQVANGQISLADIKKIGLY